MINTVLSQIFEAIEKSPSVCFATEESTATASARRRD